MKTVPARDAFGWLVFVGIFVAALSMRSPVVSPTPVMAEIAADFGIDTGTAGLLTTAPILMFAVLTPFAAVLIRRRGPELAVLLTLVGVFVGTFVRTLPGFGWMLAGMVIIGAAITIGNVVVPVIIRRDTPPQRVPMMTAVYTATLNAGSLLTTLFTAPIADAIGWVWALAVWSGLALIGIFIWGVHMRRRRRKIASDAQARQAEKELVRALTGPIPVTTASAGLGALLRRPITIMLLLCFGLQSSSYYSLTTWLPTIASDRLGVDAAAAGALSSIFQGVAVVGAFLTPLLMRLLPLPGAVGVIGLCWMSVTVGMAVAPQHMTIWMIIGAIAQAGGFVAIFALMVAASRSDAETASMSATVQGGGYVFAALGAPFTGWLHDVTGGWTAPLWVLVGATVGFAVLLVSAAFVVRRR